MSEVKVPEGYKQTEVGIIPEDWNIDTIENISNFRNGVAHEKFIDPHGKYIAVNSRFISTEGEVVKRTKELRNPAFKNEILMVMSDVPNGRAIAKCFLVPKDNTYSVNQRICALNIINDNPKYIFYQLNRNPYYLAFDDGVKQTNLRRQDVLDCPLAMPSIEEQTAIANALTDTDNLIQSLEKLITKKEAIKTGTMQQLLTGKTRLPEFATRADGSAKGFKQTELGKTPEDWKVKNIGEDSFLKARIGWQALTTNEYQTAGHYYLVTGTDFNAGEVQWNSCWYVDEWRYKQDSNIQLRVDDVLVTKDGTIGKVGYVDELPKPATLNSGVFVIRPKHNSFVPKYFFYVLTSILFREFIRNITAGSTITHLYQKDFIHFNFPVPSESEQTAIATILSDMDAEIQALQDRLEKTKAIKQGMMQQLLTGKVRLVSLEQTDKTTPLVDSGTTA